MSGAARPSASPRGDAGGRAAPGKAPAWDWELDPTAPSQIVALTRHLCALSADDCKNIANIMKTLAHRGFIFKQTSKPF